MMKNEKIFLFIITLILVDGQMQVPLSLGVQTSDLLSYPIHQQDYRPKI